MSFRWPAFGFPARCGYRFRLRGHRYPVGLNGIRTLNALATIYNATEDEKWPFHVRKLIREVSVLDSRSVLSLVIERTDDPKLRLLAIWLRGRCGGTLGTVSIAQHCDDVDRQTRRVVARALWRLSGWASLREMAASDPDPIVRRIAAGRPGRPYSQRLATFASHSRHRHLPTVRRQLAVAPATEVGAGCPPKSRSAIRAILDRIRRAAKNRIS